MHLQISNLVLHHDYKACIRSQKHHIKPQELLRLVDHAYLKPYGDAPQINELIEEAVAWGAYAICINPIYLEFAKEYLKGRAEKPKVVSVLDLHFGSLKTDQRNLLIEKVQGLADEASMVFQIGYVKSGFFDKVERDLERVISTSHRNDMKVKIIAEDPYTTREEKLYTLICQQGEDFIKTATGFSESEYSNRLGHTTSANVENVKFMAELAKELGINIGKKVAGGINS